MAQSRHRDGSVGSGPLRARRWFARRFPTVRRQLGVLSLTSILLVVATTALSLALLTRLSHANRSLEADLIPAQTQIWSLDRLYRDLEVDSSSTLTADQIASTTQIADHLTIAAAELLAADSGLSNGLSAVDDAATAWIDMLATGDERGSAAFDTLRADLTRLEGDVAERVGDRHRTASQATSALRVVLIASGALIIGFGVLAARIVRRSITRPIDDLVAQVGAVAAGDLSTTIVASGPADLASVGATVEAMRDRMLDDAERRVESALITGHLVENDRIAGQLHDDQVQAMILASIRLQRLRRKLDSDDELGSMAAAAEQATNGAITRLRRMIFELHSPVLESDGLSAAIEAYLDETFGDTVSWTVSGGSDVDLPPSTAGLLYRLSREAMFNTFKHGSASRIDVVVNRRSDVAEVTVTDDGIGFDPATQATSGPGHLGLAYCSDLAAAAGGTWTCVSQPGHGTTVRISLPIATR